jgi:uncharacterized Zn finger protein (UPF0148 family)
MTCKGICIRHKAQKPAASFGRYTTGQKRCQVCSIFMKWGGLWCPCCGCRVRTKPRNSKFKQKLNTTRKEHSENENKDQQHLLLIYSKNDVTANSSPLFVN